MTVTQQAITNSARLVGGNIAASAVETGELPSPLHEDTPSIQESTQNPTWWPTDHRHVPDYRQVRYHPEWRALSGGSRAADVFIFVLFKGCGFLAVRTTKSPRPSRTNGLDG